MKHILVILFVIFGARTNSSVGNIRIFQLRFLEKTKLLDFYFKIPDPNNYGIKTSLVA